MVDNVLSFTISSSPKEEQNRLTERVMMLVCVCKQAAIKTISDGLYTLLWCDHLSLSHTQAAIKIADVLRSDPVSLSHTHTAIKTADVLRCDPVSLSLSHTRAR